MTTARKMVLTEKGLVDRRIFADQEIYKQELEQVFGRCWLLVGHESQIPNVNDFVANYMGEDPVLVTRDSKGKLHAFLNMCRHRGNRICRADEGNAPSFMCTYHGWTFATDGKLVGVPGYKEAYFEELDRSQWGLVEARVDTYKGLIFATWDNSAPSLLDYLGDVTYYLDLVVDRRDGGTEVIKGVHRWIMKCNWKFGSDNFGGDGYHVPITHGSLGLSGFRKQQPASYGNPTGYQSSPANGHCVLSGYRGPGVNPSLTNVHLPQVAKDYMVQHLPELEQRLGNDRMRQAVLGIATVFPNFTWHFSPMIRMWHPRGPDHTEVWSYCIVDKKAPPEVKKAFFDNYLISFGPGSAQEQDDANNWYNSTAAARTWMGAKYPMNQAMGLGRESRSEIFPGIIGNGSSESNWRAFYDRWAEIMNAGSWSDIRMDKRTKPLVNL